MYQIFSLGISRSTLPLYIFIGKGMCSKGILRTTERHLCVVLFFLNNKRAQESTLKWYCFGGFVCWFGFMWVDFVSFVFGWFCLFIKGAILVLLKTNQPKSFIDTLAYKPPKDFLLFNNKCFHQRVVSQTKELFRWSEIFLWLPQEEMGHQVLFLITCLFRKYC